MMLRLKLWAAALVAAIGTFLAIYAKGRADAKASAAVKDLKEEIATNDRITKADTGADLDDAGRVARLRGFAKRHGD